MLQYFPPYFIAYVLFIIFFFLIVIVANLARTFAPRMEQKTGSLVKDWWEWLNKYDPAIQTKAILTPRYVANKQLESWSCPTCGAKLSKDDLHQLEYGYDIECE
jgi:hypothetical protein